MLMRVQLRLLCCYYRSDYEPHSCSVPLVGATSPTNFDFVTGKNEHDRLAEMTNNTWGPTPKQLQIAWLALHPSSRLFFWSHGTAWYFGFLLLLADEHVILNQDRVALLNCGGGVGPLPACLPNAIFRTQLGYLAADAYQRAG